MAHLLAVITFFAAILWVVVDGLLVLAVARLTTLCQLLAGGEETEDP